MAELARNIPFAAGLHGAGLTISASASAQRFLLSGSAAAVSSALGADVPRVPNSTADIAGIGRCLWLRPDQWLLLGPAPVSGSAWILDVSSRFAGVSIKGPRAVDLLAAGCGLDLRERSFAVAQCAQTRIDLVPAILLRVAQDEFEVMVERPLAHYFQLWLKAAAGPCHSERSEESHPPW